MTKEKIKLEVGKTYKPIYGEPVTIVSCDENSPLPFLGDDGCGYTASGKFEIGGPSNFDLVREVRPNGDSHV